ncbi:hypothetical protein BC830DRAFT_616437 [Chytriomyces sp. MP71]|nr:hypothetical protein BC830DRAFT_616437 [Chytriomyces sp. MP71]
MPPCLSLCTRFPCFQAPRLCLLASTMALVTRPAQAKSAHCRRRARFALVIPHTSCPQQLRWLWATDSFDSLALFRIFCTAFYQYMEHNHLFTGWLET